MTVSRHYDVSTHCASLTADLTRRVPELAHLVPERILFAVARSRASGLHGVYARITPLRFAGGSQECRRIRGRYQETLHAPQLRHAGQDILYLIHLMLPRFLRLSPEEKLRTLVHELYHISERCDGDIRRFGGRNYAHGTSRRTYDEHIATLTGKYLATSPSPALLSPLQITEAQWRTRQVRITGLTVPRPKLHIAARQRL